MPAQTATEKNPRTETKVSTRGFPIFIRWGTVSLTLLSARDGDVVPAGLLTSGSFYSPHLPNFNYASTVTSLKSVVFVIFVPGYSGGPVPEFHEVPC